MVDWMGAERAAMLPISTPCCVDTCVRLPVAADLSSAWNVTPRSIMLVCKCSASASTAAAPARASDCAAAWRRQQQQRDMRVTGQMASKCVGQLEPARL